MTSSEPGTLPSLAVVVRAELWPQVGVIDAGAYPEAVLQRFCTAGVFEQHPEAALPGLEPLREGVGDGPREWVMAKAQFAVFFGERFTRAMAA